MKKNLSIAVRLTLVMVLVCAVIYPLLIAMVGKLAPGGGKGQTEKVNGQVVGYTNVGQSFTAGNYFWGRPSAVNYNAAGSAGSNKGPSNPDYLQLVNDRINDFIAHHPGVKRENIPAEMVTASGSGLDPHISPAAAYLQVGRIAAARQLPKETINKLIATHTQSPLAGILGPSRVNVLQLNIALDALQ